MLIVKKRKKGPVRVVYGFGEHLQEDLERYQGVRELAGQLGWQLIAVQEQFETRLARLIDAGAVEGVIGGFVSEQWLSSLPRSIPLVHVGQHSTLPHVASVRFDGRRIGQLAARHLWEQGYRNFAYVGIPGSWGCREQEEGFAAALPQRPPCLRAGARGVLEDFLARTEVPLGVFCHSDFVARRVLHAAERLGRPVPARIGVVGVGNHEWDRVQAGVGISSIPLPHQEQGRLAAALLARLLADGQVASAVLAPLALIARDSSTPAGDPAGRLRKAEARFRGQLAQSISMEDVAAECGMSRRSLELYFTRHCGKTPYARLLELRLEESQRLLRETDASITRIGEQVGFPDPPRFSAFFRKQTGQSPSAWRQAARASGETP